MEWHKTYKCKCRLDASVCNNKQTWNEDKCRCECKELIDKGICDKGFICNSSNCECECHKSFDVGEYLDYKNFKCKNKFADKLVGQCIENIDGNEMFHNETLDVISLNDYKKVCNTCTIYTVLFAVFFITILAVFFLAVFFIYFQWYIKNKNLRIKFYRGTQKTIY